MSHSFLAFLGRHFGPRGEEWVILQCAPRLNEVTVEGGQQMSVQSVEREEHAAGLPTNEDGLRQ